MTPCCCSTSLRGLLELLPSSCHAHSSSSHLKSSFLSLLSSSLLLLYNFDTNVKQYLEKAPKFGLFKHSEQCLCLGQGSYPNIVKTMYANRLLSSLSAYSSSSTQGVLVDWVLAPGCLALQAVTPPVGSFSTGTRIHRSWKVANIFGTSKNIFPLTLKSKGVAHCGLTSHWTKQQIMVQ